MSVKMKYSPLLFGVFMILFALALVETPNSHEAYDHHPAVVGAAPWPPPDIRVSWVSDAFHGQKTTHIKLLAFNDFHGNLQPPVMESTRTAGGAAVLAAYLKSAARGAADRTLIIHAGDHVGASPPISRLLRDEPSIEFLNLLANSHCGFGVATHFYDAQSWQYRPNRCNVIGTLGNHEFDGGVVEIRRLLRGGNAAAGSFLEPTYRGSRIPYVSANVRNRRTGQLILPPYAVVVLGATPIGVIGAVLRETPTTVMASAVADVEFLDEAQSINLAAAELRRQGIHTLIVAIHQGMVPMLGPEGYDWRGPLRDIVSRLDEDIDVVISGHTHNYTNALFPNRGGRPVLVTQAYAYGVAYADIDLQIDPVTRDVVKKSAIILPTWDDAGPGRTPDQRVQRLTLAAERAVASRVVRVVGYTADAITRELTPSGESALGDLVADAQRAATHADIALMNPNGLRSDLPSGSIRRGDILTLHPFGNRLVTIELSGAQIQRVLEEQWSTDSNALPRILEISGINYVWDPAKSAGAHVVALCGAHNELLDSAMTYRVTINDFLAGGGDGFTELKDAPNGKLGPLDSEALEQYFEARKDPIQVRIEGRIARTDVGPAGTCQRRMPDVTP
jgi:5'-nucleotidase